MEEGVGRRGAVSVRVVGGGVGGPGLKPGGGWTMIRGKRIDRWTR